VQLEAKQVLRVWADLVHRWVLVANVHLVVLRHDGQGFRVLGEVASVVVMEQKVLLMSPPDSMFVKGASKCSGLRGDARRRALP
jgi:hypothetical protein